MSAAEPKSVETSRCWRRLGALLILILSLTATVNAGRDDEFIPTMPAERAKALLDSGEKIILIDLRPTSDYQKGRLPGARSIPIGDLEKRSAEVPQTGRVILYCGCPPGGVDESYAYLTLRGKGHRNATVLEEGFAGWVKRKYPTETRR